MFSLKWQCKFRFILVNWFIWTVTRGCIPLCNPLTLTFKPRSGGHLVSFVPTHIFLGPDLSSGGPKQYHLVLMDRLSNKLSTLWFIRAPNNRMRSGMQPPRRDEQMEEERCVEEWTAADPVSHDQSSHHWMLAVIEGPSGQSDVPHGGPYCALSGRNAARLTVPRSTVCVCRTVKLCMDLSFGPSARVFCPNICTEIKQQQNPLCVQSVCVSISFPFNFNWGRFIREH